MPFVATIHPNRIVKRYINPERDLTQKHFDKLIKSSSKSLQNLKIKKRSFLLSSQSKSKLRDSIQLLHELSRPRTVFVSSSKSIFNFRSSFITLTLPSVQIHSDLEIKKCLNNFLVRLRGTYGVKNYVWKAELQKNENIHFHLVIDQYIPFQAVRYYWNLAINTLGYVDRYASKMQRLSLKEYASLRGKSVAASLQSFQKGCKEKWQNPPTEQAIAVRNKLQLAKYLSKYLTKGNERVKSKAAPGAEKVKINISEVVRAVKFGRVWARSQSLSKIKVVTRWAWDDVLEMLKSHKEWRKFFTHKVYDYCEIYYFNFKEMSYLIKKKFQRIIKDIGTSYAYPFPV